MFAELRLKYHLLFIMKNQFNKGILAIGLLLSVMTFSCGEDEDKEEGPSCYTCTECTGQYAHLLNDREYCVDGFDNRSDWEANKTAMEGENGCTCK